MSMTAVVIQFVVWGVSRKDWNKNEVQGVKMGNYHPK